MLERGHEVAGRYSITGIAGRGACATVYRASDRVLGRDVAIKVMSLAGARDEDIRRFAREARALGRLRHASVAEVYEVGREAEFEYLVMQFVEGDSLDDLTIREGLLLPSRWLPWIRDVTAGLVAVHDAGLVHRDIKPANIRIDAGSRKAVLVDFGLAFASDHDGTMGRFTRDGLLVGTPVYISPEQVRAKSVGPEADVYGLGCVLYELLVGEPPFVGEVADVLAKHLHLPPLPPSERAPRTVAPDLEQLVMRMLSKKRGFRPSAGEVFEDLSAVLNKDTERGRAERSTLPPVAVGEEPEESVVGLKLFVPGGVSDELRLSLSVNDIHLVDSEGEAEVCYFASKWRDRLGARESNVPAVVLLPEDEIDELANVVRAGAADVVLMPVDTQALVRKLRRVARSGG